MSDMIHDLVEMDDLRAVDLEARIQIATKVGRLLSRAPARAGTGGALSGVDVEQAAATELARCLLEDVSVSVRAALAKELKQCNFIPKDMVEKISTDIDEISFPFLMAAEALQDDMLEMIVRECGSSQQSAIAGRVGLSEVVSFAICDVADMRAVDVLMGNATAELSERSFDRVVSRFPREVSVLEKMASRGDLAFTVVERIIFKVSEAYGEILTARFKLSSDYASYIISLASRQIFTRTLEAAPLFELQNYLDQLRRAGGLTSDILLSYLQHRHVRLFIAAVAVLTGLPYTSVENRIGSHNRNALSRLLEQGGFSGSVIGVLLIAYDRLFRG